MLPGGSAVRRRTRGGFRGTPGGAASASGLLPARYPPLRPAAGADGVGADLLSDHHRVDGEPRL